MEMDRLVREIAAALEPELNVPFALFGHSMGSLVAFAVAQRFKALGLREPMCLLASGGVAPFERERRNLGPMSDDDIVAWLRKMGGTPEELLQDAEMRAHLTPIVRADLAVISSYRHAERPQLSCPVHAFGGREDPGVSIGRLAAWRRVTSGPFSQHVFEGDHYFILPRWREVTSQIAARMVPAGGDSRSSVIRPWVAESFEPPASR
jgi:surfactin synthase thioesterase subunit